MDVEQAIASRKSIRAFQDTPVPLELLREVLAAAARAPSGGNLQPWYLHVLTGPALERLKQRMTERLKTAGTDTPDYEIYPPDLHEPYRTRRYRIGESMYALLGIERADRAGRLASFARNYTFFGAPAGLLCYVDRRMGPPQWADLGMYLQSVMLLLRQRGLDSCAQECWSVYNRTVAECVNPAPELLLFCGMAIGYSSTEAPVNALHSERAPLEEFAQFHHE